MELKYIVYITINLCNGKFYIGVHKTNPDVFDGYIGGGVYRQSEATKNTPFHKAVKKYGYENFKRTILKIFPNTEDGRNQAYALEEVLVNSDMLKAKTTYNLALGGKGSVGLEDRKTVYMFDLNGEYLRSFKSAKDAAIFLEKDVYSGSKSIRNNCLGSSQSSFGYYWSYKKEFNYHGHDKPIAQYTLNGKFLRSFSNITEAEEEMHLNSIKQAIAKKYSCGGYQWRYYNGDNSDISKLMNIMTRNKLLPIIMKDKDGNVLKEYESVHQCVIENPELQTSQINRVLKNVIRTHKGYIFEYKDKDIV